MLLCLLSQRSLHLSSFPCILSPLFCSTYVISTTLVFQLTYLFFCLIFLMLIPSSAFFVSVTVVFNSPCLYFIFSKSLLKTSCNFSCSTSILFQSSWIIFTVITLNSFSGILPSPFCLVVLLRFYFVPLSETYSFAVSVCLNFYLYFYVYGRLVMFLVLGELALCRGCPMCSSSSLPCHHPRARFQLVLGRFSSVFADSFLQAMGS